VAGRTGDTPGAAAGPAAAAPAAAAGEGALGGPSLNVQGLPLLKPPYAKISAIDLNKGDILWQIAHGETADNVRNNPGAEGLNIPRTGRPGLSQSLVTKTLVIAGEGGVFTTPSGQRGAMLRAVQQDGRQRRGCRLHAGARERLADDLHAQRQQYIVLAISGGNYSGELLAFRLPGS